MIEIADPRFRDAVAAIDSGDVATLKRLLSEHPGLANERLEPGDRSEGERYFARPYLLWFVAENPVRRGTLPRNIAELTRVIVQAARQREPAAVQEQIDSALGLVASGRVPRECGVQNGLIDVLIEAGARGEEALVSALAHRETGAAEHLLARGTPPTLLAAVCLGRAQEMERLAGAATAAERQLALAGAALYGRADALARLVRLGVDVNAYGPRGFHPHATALHQAAGSGSLDAVKVLVEAGADLRARDHVYKGPPLGWAVYGGHPEVAGYIRRRLAGQMADALTGAGLLRAEQTEEAAALLAPLVDH